MQTLHIKLSTNVQNPKSVLNGGVWGCPNLDVDNLVDNDVGGMGW